MLKSALTSVKEKEYYTGPPSPGELRLRYLTVDEALPRLERFLHDSYLSGLSQVKIIHGKGTGTLRLLVRRELIRHSLVKSFRPGEKWEGGRRGYHRGVKREVNTITPKEEYTDGRTLV